MKTRSFCIALFVLVGTAAFAQSDCHLMMDKSTDGTRLKATKRSALVELTDFGMGIMLQNLSGTMKMFVDVAISSKRITAKSFDRGKQCTIAFALQDGDTVKFDITEPKLGSGGKLQSWGNYEIGGIIDVRKGQIDTLQKSPIKILLFSFYGLPADTITTLPSKDYFVKNLPCMKIEK